MAHVSHRLSGSFEGALAGGGDPATSPLYVFGPFLRLIVGAGVAAVTFGASVWLAVLTVVTVSAMYRLVMGWVTDGSGGSGLNEEEFGPWAVKVNASITVIEYTLTFLVSIAALVTFAADRFPLLGERVLGLPVRTIVAVVLSVLTGVAVNRGSKVAARVFGPATLAVLLLLWVMIFATVARFGLTFPSFHLAALSPRYLGLTLGGYAHILALMTGIEIFANLVAAYQGSARERSRKAFGSLVIVMGTTSLTMLLVGPAILALSDPHDPHVSVFTQTMDRLLPGPIAYLGTLVGIAVLLSAAAASAQGIQNLALGLRHRHYIPAYLGQRNRFDVADKPAWLEVFVCVCCFVAFGTAEETYLALYAAGVFILLSLTGWAAVKRLARELRAEPNARNGASLLGASAAAVLTSAATLIIFEDRFFEGAWAYALLVPVLYFAFGAMRGRLGAPSPVEDRLGKVIASSCLPPQASVAIGTTGLFRGVLLPLDRTPEAEHTMAVARVLASAYGARITLLSVLEKPEVLGSPQRLDAEQYLNEVAADLRAVGLGVDIELRSGTPAEQIARLANSEAIDAVVMTTHGRAGWQNWLAASVTSKVIYQTTPPLVVVRPTSDWRSTRTRFGKLLVALDGSAIAEQVLPHVQAIAARFSSEVLLLSVPEGSDSEAYQEKLEAYLGRIVSGLVTEGIPAVARLESGAPAQAILRTAAAHGIDTIMMVSHGRGGIERQAHVKLGSVATRVIQETPRPVFLVSAVGTPVDGPTPAAS